jgi:cation diffusion facilitator CzcD-associated flavoprotein CzcO
VGAGPSGLAAARALKLNGLDFDVFERHRDVGGIWDMENPGTPMYDSAHFISSRTQSAFDGFPMPDDFADYPARAKILEYIRPSRTATACASGSPSARTSRALLAWGRNGA